MSDPAIEAADRACDGFGYGDINSAREMAKPIRALHYAEPYAQGPDYCAGCECKWPCETAELIYTTAELGAGAP